MFKAVLSKPMILTNSIATIAELIDEGIFKLKKDGVSFLAADRALVAVVDFYISSEAFDSYEIDKEHNIALNIASLLSVLKRASSRDKLSLELKDNKLEIRIENSSKRRFIVPLLDLTEEEVPPVDQLEFSAQVKIKPEIVQSGIEDAEIIADSVIFEISPDGFLMRAEGDISQTELRLEKGNDALLDLKTDGVVKARYPLDYLKKMIKAAKLSESVSIKLGQDYPMRLEFHPREKVSLSFVLAPRVSEE